MSHATTSWGVDWPLTVHGICALISLPMPTEIRNKQDKAVPYLIEHQHERGARSTEGRSIVECLMKFNPTCRIQSINEYVVEVESADGSLKTRKHHALVCDEHFPGVNVDYMRSSRRVSSKTGRQFTLEPPRHSRCCPSHPHGKNNRMKRSQTTTLISSCHCATHGLGELFQLTLSKYSTT